MRGLLQGFRQQVEELDPFDLSLWLTLMLVLVKPGPPWPWPLVILSTTLGVAGVLAGELRRHPAFWFVMAAVFFSVNNVAYWESSDNHKFLTSYWCLAIACSLCLTDRQAALATSGRILVGLVFLWATVWKATSVE